MFVLPQNLCVKTIPEFPGMRKNVNKLTLTPGDVKTMPLSELETIARTHTHARDTLRYNKKSRHFISGRICVAPTRFFVSRETALRMMNFRN